MAVYGTPHIYALAAKLTEDRIPGTSPGFGSAAAADGIRYPYIFPIAATYWSQGTAAVDFVKKQLGTASRARRSRSSSTTTPPGGSRSRCSRISPSSEGFELKMFAVPPPGVEMGAQVLDIAQRFRADFVIGHLFGGAPGRVHQGVQAGGLSAPQVRVVRVGLGGGQYRGGRRLRRRRGLLHHAVRGRGRGLPRPERDPRDVQEAGEAGAEGDGLHRLLQPRRPHRGAPRRGHPPRGGGEARREDHRRRHQGRLREDLELHPGRAGAAAQDHPDRPRGRRARADLAGEGRQVREGRPTGTRPTRTWWPSTSRRRRK